MQLIKKDSVTMAVFADDLAWLYTELALIKLMVR
jgi:hypothetical protein